MVGYERKYPLQSGFGENRYTFNFNVQYGYNYTYESYGNFAFLTTIPFNKYFDMDARILTSTANYHTFGLVLRPKIPLKVGELFFETRVQYTLVTRDHIHETCGALSFGYRMDYISLQLGCFTRVFTPFHMNRDHGYGYTSENYSIYWRAEGYVRPQNFKWNIALSIGNNDDYQLERMWQPTFAIKGWYNVNDHWRAEMKVQCKPTGMFHLNASFYEAIVGIGCTYRL